MRREIQIKLAEVLIAFSMILIFTGIGLDLNNKVLDPITDTHVIGAVDSEDVNVTTTETELPTEEEEPTTPVPTTPSIPSTSSGESSNTTVSTPQVTNPQPTQPTQPSTPQQSQNTYTPPSIEETNNILRNNIQNTYGITVKYGAETNGYTVAGLATIMLSDANRINELLNQLNYNLSLYPQGIFNETKQGGYTLTFYLIKRYSQNNVTGITDSSTKNVVISLATDYSFADSIHHEIYHYLEKYMYYKGANYTIWNSLNPLDFIYGKTNTALSYTSGNNIYASFVNDYAQTDEYEDRASTFEYLMAQSEASCLTTGTTIWKKSKYMCEQIDAVFQTVSPAVTEYWERYVYN